MPWPEMSYERYSQFGLNDVEPEVWDDIYEPTEAQYIAWAMEKQES